MADRRDKLHEEIEELFADLWQVPRFAGMHRGFRPNVDSFQTDEPSQLTVVVELPGVDLASLTLVAHERTLLISGERLRRRLKGAIYQQMEIEYGHFQRQIRLSLDVDPEGARARYDRGILTVTLPISEEPAPQGARFTITVTRI
jgi:HSP20 family protein